MATVNINTGLVTAVAAGTTNIVATATDGSGVSGSRTLTVNTTEVLVSGITVTRDRSSILDNETEPFTAIVAPANATDSSVTWSSSNTSVATVNPSTGLVSAVAAGSATITATANDGSNVTGSAGITVTASEILVGSITVSSLRSSIPDNETEQFDASVTPGNASNQSVSWSSSNTGVATVNASTGLVSAVAAGTTNITATANDGSGVSGSKTLAVTSTNTPPTVALRENNLVPTGAFPKTINFAITSSNDDGTIVSYAWDFEGSSAPEITNTTHQNVSYEYNAPGNYSVTIVVTDDGGARGTDTIVVTLDEPVAEYTFNERTGLFTAPAGAVINITVETTGEAASGRFNVGTSPNSQNIEALATATGLTCAPEVDCEAGGEGVDFATGNFTMPSTQVYFSFSHNGSFGSSSIMSFTFNSSGGTRSITVD